MILTNSQKKAVDLLFERFLKREKDKFCYFKAPTGSGKTFMASEFISRVFGYNLGDNNKKVFVFATVSNADLPKQLTNKLNDYKKFHEFNDYKIEYINSPTNIKTNKIEDIKEFNLEENKIFVFGTSSFGKNTLFHQNRTLETFIQSAKNENYQIFFIRDEAHIGRKEGIGKNELKNFDQKMKEAASFIVEMTATPKDKSNLVEITNDEIQNDGDKILLKNDEKKLIFQRKK